MEQPQGDPRIGPEVGLRVLRDSTPLLIDLVEEGGETSEGDQGLFRVWQGYTLATRVE